MLQLKDIPMGKLSYKLKDKQTYFIIKGIIDELIAYIALALLSPLMLLAAALIKLTSNGPVFYSQHRVGRFGRIFNLHKFRTMIVDAEKYSGPVLATENDTRVTPVGRILRRTRIDELPQLLNVIRGEMSIVGPRPERPFFVSQHKELRGDRLSVNPGLTGLQCSSRP